MPTHSPVLIDELFGKLEPFEGEAWCVVHTKPRAEKRLADYARRLGITYYLPQHEREHLYQHRKVMFKVPMFPGYLFIRSLEDTRQKLLLSGNVVRFIKVKYQRELLGELMSIFLSKQHQADLDNVLWLEKGLRVEIISGPLKGVTGVVESHEKIEDVQLQINILRQAVKVRVKTADLRIIGEYTVVENI
ncbi:MAG TPA: transcription termination/antitermination NusG family protein [Candidatus Cloacimonadota bacterium]|nr:transcription termination/antitermination NusG family protein [Candidatus Cloacimonadota bacterium]HPS37897.1 transcription termination/antitermination NusG family protein [Candidatus Cloacimonadota bacterium]